MTNIQAPTVPPVERPSVEPNRARTGADLLLLLIASMILLAVWSFVVPMLETPDEPHHWQFARYLHDYHRLPVYGPEFVEANSPPLYYLLLAPLARRTPLPPPAAWYDGRGRLTFPFNPRFFHNAGDDWSRYWPLRTARLLTALMSVLTVWLIYRAGSEATGRAHTGLLAGALVAFLPQFTFRGTGINNDALLATTGAVFVLLLTRLVRRGFTIRLAVLAGLAVALAYLTKINAICLAPAFALFLLTEPVPWPVRARRAIVLLVPLVIVAPWSLRNVLLYGDPFASGAMHSAISVLMDVKPLTSLYFVTVFPEMLSKSLVGLFGWMNLPMPAWTYWVFAGLALAALAGLVLAVVRRQGTRLVLLLGTVVVCNLGVVVHINRTYSQPQGRYLFPALAALALLGALGLERIPGWFARAALYARVAAVTLAALNIWVLATVVWPAYYPALTSTISPDALSLAPGAVHSLTAMPDGTYRVAGEDSQMAFDTNVDAGGYPFLRFEIAGRAAAPSAVGAVYFAINGSASEAQKATFEWIADGQPRVITIALLANPLWKGQATSVRIDPIDAGPFDGAVVAVRDVRLLGNLGVASP